MFGLTNLSCSSNTGGSDSIGKPSDTSGVEQFLESYFASWSSGDMGGYKEHFHENAVIAVRRGRGVEAWVPRDRFVRQQTAIIEKSARKLSERMTSYVAEEDAEACSAVVRWELTRGTGASSEKTRGVDRFTLVKDANGTWKIASLLFYSTE